MFTCFYLNKFAIDSPWLEFCAEANSSKYHIMTFIMLLNWPLPLRLLLTITCHVSWIQTWQDRWSHVTRHTLGCGAAWQCDNVTRFIVIYSQGPMWTIYLVSTHRDTDIRETEQIKNDNKLTVNNLFIFPQPLFCSHLLSYWPRKRIINCVI